MRKECEDVGLGSIVIYDWFTPQGKILGSAPAIVTKVHTWTPLICDLHVFFNIDNDGMLGSERYRVTAERVENKPNGIATRFIPE